MRNSEQLNTRIGVASSGTSLFLATIEAVCVFVVSANGVAALVGSAGIVLTEGARAFHQAAIRLPLLALATAIALFNLWMLLNTWRLRRAPRAQWRLRPLPASKRRQIALVAALSLLTLVAVGAELFVHHKLHGSALAGTLRVDRPPHEFSGGLAAARSSWVRVCREARGVGLRNRFLSSASLQILK